MKPDPKTGDRLAQWFGMEVLEVGPGRAKVRMAISEKLFNAADMVHGGALFSLADYAFALAGRADLERRGGDCRRGHLRFRA